MRGCISNVHRRNSRGFTLIEVLVIVVIVGVLATALVLSVTSDSARQLGREAERARALIGYACEQAELRGREIGVSLNADGYRFSQLDGDVWNAFRGGELRPRHWLASTAPKLSRDGHTVEIAAQFPEKPQLLCFSSGELTPFRLELALGEAATRYRLDGDASGNVALAAVDAHAR